MCYSICNSIKNQKMKQDNDVLKKVQNPCNLWKRVENNFSFL